jgi:hypothetical protein
MFLLLSGCGQRPSQSPVAETSTPAPSTPQVSAEPESTSSAAPEPKEFEIPYTKNRLSFAGYVITIKPKQVRGEDYIAENEVAVLKKNGKVIREFDAVRHPLGGYTKLALVSVLGNRTKQLIVEQTGPREWAYWVVALKPHFRVVFTNTDYPLDHEPEIKDLDSDGLPELLMTLNTFWFFDGLCGACSPRFAVALKYDKRRRSFRPANHLMKGLCDTPEELAQAEQKIRSWQSENPDINSNQSKAMDLYSKVLEHALPLIYCGKEDLGWSFFDRLYNLPDREIRKSTIKGTLKHDRVYREIQNDLRRIRRKTSLH